MKLIDGVVLTKLQEETVAVAVGEAAKRFKGMIKLNETAAFLATLLKQEQSEEGLVEALLREYDVEREVAARNVRYVIEQLSLIGLIE